MTTVSKSKPLGNSVDVDFATKATEYAKKGYADFSKRDYAAISQEYYDVIQKNDIGITDMHIEVKSNIEAMRSMPSGKNLELELKVWKQLNEIWLDEARYLKEDEKSDLKKLTDKISTIEDANSVWKREMALAIGNKPKIEQVPGSEYYEYFSERVAESYEKGKAGNNHELWLVYDVLLESIKKRFDGAVGTVKEEEKIKHSQPDSAIIQPDLKSDKISSEVSTVPPAPHLRSPLTQFGKDVSDQNDENKGTSIFSKIGERIYAYMVPDLRTVHTSYERNPVEDEEASKTIEKNRFFARLWRRGSKLSEAEKDKQANSALLKRIADIRASDKLNEQIRTEGNAQGKNI
jgi:hypothetical protein